MHVRLGKEVFRCELDVVGLVVWYSVAFQVGSFLLIFSLGCLILQATEVVPPNARSHTCLLSGKFLGGVQVLVRLAVGIEAQKQVAMKLMVRSEDPAVSDIIHEIIANA